MGPKAINRWAGLLRNIIEDVSVGRLSSVVASTKFTIGNANITNSNAGDAFRRGLRLGSVPLMNLAVENSSTPVVDDRGKNEQFDKIWTKNLPQLMPKTELRVVCRRFATKLI